MQEVRFTTLATDGVVVLVVVGEVDAGCADELYDAVVRAQAAHERDVTIDLAGVTFMDSRGLATLVRAHRQLATVDHRLRIQNPRSSVAKVLDITGVAEYLERFDHRQRA